MMNSIQIFTLANPVSRGLRVMQPPCGTVEGLQQGTMNPPHSSSPNVRAATYVVRSRTYIKGMAPEDSMQHANGMRSCDLENVEKFVLCRRLLQ